MSFWKKRSGAILAAVLIIILSSFFAANRSLNEKIREVSDLFSNGVYDLNVGYKQKSVKSQLEVRTAASMNLISVGANYKDTEKETEKLRDARNVLQNGLSRSVGPEKLYDQNKDIQTAFDALAVKLSAMTLDAGNKTILDDSKSRMVNSAAMIEKSGYNEAVREFNRKVLSIFPTNYIKQFAMVKEPELFE
jgi:hypothetical protein